MVLKYYAATVVGTLMLMITTREILFRENLIDNGLGTRASEKIDCSERSKWARTEDGRCNDPKIPLMGARHIPLGRNVKREAVRNADTMHLMEPNPIAISRELLRRGDKTIELPLNTITTAWIQFQNHDWFDHNNTEKDYSSYLKVEIPAPYRKDFQQTGISSLIRKITNTNNHMMVPRSKTLAPQKDANGRSYPVLSNRVTHWWDASQVYGSEASASGAMRAFEGGRLTVDSRNLIPFAKEDLDISTPAVGHEIAFNKDTERTGFTENWWVGLSLLHNTFVRNHNLIANDKELRKQVEERMRDGKSTLSRFDRKSLQVVDVPRSTVFAKDGTIVSQALFDETFDQRLYDTARLINAGLIAKIHTVEWTPAVFDTSPLDLAMRTNWLGLLEGQLDKSESGRSFWTAVKKTAHVIGLDALTKKQKIFGLLGGEKDLYDVPFTITEEFTAVYRLHSLLPDSMTLRDASHKSLGVVGIEDTRLEKSKALVDKYGLGTLFYSAGHTKPGALVLQNYPRFLQDLDLPIVGRLDMGAIDVLRDRERGVPRYNEFRRQIHLAEIVSFADLFTYDSNLSYAKDECENLDKELLPAHAAGYESMSLLSRWAYSRRLESGLKPFDLRHCRLQKMSGRVSEFKVLFQNSTRSSDDEQKMHNLKKQILSDIAEREKALKPPHSALVAKMRTLYNTPKIRKAFELKHQAALELADNVEALDLMVGSHAETTRNPAEPEKGYIGLGLGETQFQIFVLMASRRLLADRFFTENYNAETYTARGLQLIQDGSMRGVLSCTLKKEFPKIDEALKCGRSAFHPWNDVTKSTAAVCKSLGAKHEKQQLAQLARYQTLCR